MKTIITHHPDGTAVIHWTAETPEDFEATKLLIDRYDTVPVINGEGILGSWSGTGAFLDIIVYPLTAEEIARNDSADGFIQTLNGRVAGEPKLIPLKGEETKLLTGS
jgi:hypothetical protein